jgi:hypothetical protein
MTFGFTLLFFPLFFFFLSSCIFLSFFTVAPPLLFFPFFFFVCLSSCVFLSFFTLVLVYERGVAACFVRVGMCLSVAVLRATSMVSTCLEKKKEEEEEEEKKESLVKCGHAAAVLVRYDRWSVHWFVFAARRFDLLFALESVSYGHPLLSDATHMCTLSRHIHTARP